MRVSLRLARLPRPVRAKRAHCLHAMLHTLIDGSDEAVSLCIEFKVGALISRVRHSVAIYGQLLLFCDQSMREKAWHSRKRGA